MFLVLGIGVTTEPRAADCEARSDPIPRTTSTTRKYESCNATKTYEINS